jgi:hypothetical protein
MDSHPSAPTDNDRKRLPSGACVDSCSDCGTTIIGATLDEVLGARCACPPTRYAYLVELQWALCARPATSIRVPTPRTRVVLLRPIRCQTCGGAAVQGDVLRVAVREPIVFRDRPPRLGRPPKWLVEQHRLRRTP